MVNRLLTSSGQGYGYMREQSFVEQLTKTKKTKETRVTTAEEHYKVWSE